MKLRRGIYIALGAASMTLGAIGAFVPLLPSVPFLMLAAFFFAKSSERIHCWFVGTRLYKENLESYVNRRGMTYAAKFIVILTVSAVMAVGFVTMHEVVVGRVVLVCIWLLHIVYFLFGVKTLSKEKLTADIQKRSNDHAKDHS